LRAVVTETRQGSDFAAFLGRSFDASKAGLTTALTDAAQNAVSQERRDTVLATGMVDGMELSYARLDDAVLPTVA
jgi:hypothetical protein